MRRKSKNKNIVTNTKLFQVMLCYVINKIIFLYTIYIYIYIMQQDNIYEIKEKKKNITTKKKQHLIAST